MIAPGIGGIIGGAIGQELSMQQEVRVPSAEL